MALLLDRHAPVWQISEYRHQDISHVNPTATDVLAEWKSTHDAADEVDFDTVNHGHLTERKERSSGLPPELGVSQQRITFESVGSHTSR